MKTFLGKYKFIGSIIVLIAVIFKITSFFTAFETTYAAGSEYPKHYIYQVRDGNNCSYPYDCVEPNHDIFYKLQLKPGPGDTCYFPNSDITVPRSQLISGAIRTELTLNRVRIILNPPYNENCEFETKLKYTNILANPTTFPYIGSNHYLRIKIYSISVLANPRLQSIYSFGTPLIVRSPETCQGETMCSDSIKHINEYVWKICSQVIGFPDQYKKCEQCVNQAGVWTAIGCIPTDTESILQVMIRVGLLMGGGIALLIILAGAFILSISQGDPKKTSEAKDMITSALIGLIFIIFSVSILQFIGVQILKIPEFGQKTIELPLILR